MKYLIHDSFSYVCLQNIEPISMCKLYLDLKVESLTPRPLTGGLVVLGWWERTLPKVR